MPSTKLSISVPEDVARWLAEQPNASAAVTQAVRRQMYGTPIEDLLRANGVDVTEEGKARWRTVLSRPIDPDVWAAGRRALAHADGPPDE